MVSEDGDATPRRDEGAVFQGNYWIEREGKKPLYAQFGGISLTPEPLTIIADLPFDRDRHAHVRNEILTRLLADTCEICGSHEQIEGHHIWKLSDLNVEGRKDAPNWKRVMASRKRKTLFVCKFCHVAILAGTPTRTPQSIV
jgi:hypothetical protein